MRWEAFLSLWQNAYAYATILLPSLLLCRRYFKGEIRFGDISQASFAFHTCAGWLAGWQGAGRAPFLRCPACCRQMHPLAAW